VRQLLGCAALSLLCGRAIAEPADYVYEPAVSYGEREIDFKAGRAAGNGVAPASAASLGFGYGATPWWFSEFYVKYKRDNGGPTAFDAYEWENKFQLTETGKYPVDLGFVIELERPQDRSEGYEVRFGPLLQTDFERVQANANLLFQRDYRSAVPNDLVMGYQGQLKYRYRPEFEFGVQAFGDMGKWDRWAPRQDQSHRLGPAVFGRIKLGGRQALRYNAAYLFGVTAGAPDRTLRMQIEYEF
jgi:hypothetical protein